jgi:hypothetical protein
MAVPGAKSGPNEKPRPRRDEERTSAASSRREAAASAPPARANDSFILNSVCHLRLLFFVG